MKLHGTEHSDHEMCVGNVPAKEEEQRPTAARAMAVRPVPNTTGTGDATLPELIAQMEQRIEALVGHFEGHAPATASEANTHGAARVAIRHLQCKVAELKNEHQQRSRFCQIPHLDEQEAAAADRPCGPAIEMADGARGAQPRMQSATPHQEKKPAQKQLTLEAYGAPPPSPLRRITKGKAKAATSGLLEQRDGGKQLTIGESMRRAHLASEHSAAAGAGDIGGVEVADALASVKPTSIDAAARARAIGGVEVAATLASDNHTSSDEELRARQLEMGAFFLSHHNVCCASSSAVAVRCIGEHLLTRMAACSREPFDCSAVTQYNLCMPNAAESSDLIELFTTKQASLVFFGLPAVRRSASHIAPWCCFELPVIVAEINDAGSFYMLCTFEPLRSGCPTYDRSSLPIDARSFASAHSAVGPSLHRYGGFDNYRRQVQHCLAAHVSIGFASVSLVKRRCNRDAADYRCLALAVDFAAGSVELIGSGRASTCTSQQQGFCSDTAIRELHLSIVRELFPAEYTPGNFEYDNHQVAVQQADVSCERIHMRLFDVLRQPQAHEW